MLLLLTVSATAKLKRKGIGNIERSINHCINPCEFLEKKLTVFFFEPRTKPEKFKVCKLECLIVNSLTNEHQK